MGLDAVSGIHPANAQVPTGGNLTWDEGQVNSKAQVTHRNNLGITLARLSRHAMGDKPSEGVPFPPERDIQERRSVHQRGHV
jgi:hypothetical protein